MSTFSVPVIPITKVEKHPNADTLSITEVEGCPVIFRTGDFTLGQYAVYVPVEAVVPVDKPAFAFLKKKEGQTTHRVKAVKLRGIFSMGLLVPLSELPPGFTINVGQETDCAEALGIVKYEEPEKNMTLGARRERRPPDGVMAPIYDIESHRKYRRVYQPGEEVVVTEKIHGCNGRFVWREAMGEEPARLFVGSRCYFNVESEKDVWWKVAKQYGLAEKLARRPGLVLYGEVYGQVQDLKYDSTPEDPLRFAAFDAFDKAQGKYLDYLQFYDLCQDLGVPMVPLLYQGPYSDEVIDKLALGNSVLADQIKEGVVIKPVIERFDYKLGRVITKLVGEQYLLRKGGTEYQ